MTPREFIQKLERVVRDSTMTCVIAGRGDSAIGRRRFRIAVAPATPGGESTVLARSSAALTIGSSRAADLHLDEPTVSRLHARLEPQEDGVHLIDLGSKNGTFLGAIRVVHAFLPEHAAVRLGGLTLDFALEGEFEERELARDPRFGELIGQSVAMRELFARLDQFARNDLPVLLWGESGTGKELAAEAIHGRSSRRDGPFIVVDCGSLPATLIESELFGHERGAFTGASTARAGAFELAHGGTLFLDEIGELELGLQSRLLRAVESRHIRRIGGDRERAVDIRVIAATNRDLAAMVSNGDFREDLYHRINVLWVRLPPLRERVEDLEILAHHFAERAVHAYPAAQPDVITPDVLAAMSRRSWPGNVRELRNFVDRLVLLGPRPAWELATTPAEPQIDVAPPGWLELPFDEARAAALAEFERRYVEAAVARSGSNVAAAARAAGVHRGYLFRLLRRHGLRRDA